MEKTAERTLILWVFVILITFCGCRQEPLETNPECVVVQRIELSRGALQRVYTQNEKMEKVLDYLRMADPYGQPEEDPLTTPGSRYQIRIYCSDGQQKSYYQISDRFLSSDGIHWQKIKKGMEGQLDALLAMPSDEKKQA